MIIWQLSIISFIYLLFIIFDICLHVDEYEVELILQHRICKHNCLKYLVKWKNYNENNNTWEPETNIFPHASATISNYCHQFKKQLFDNKKSDTIIRDVQGELSCPHFHNEPERLYRKRYTNFYQ